MLSIVVITTLGSVIVLGGIWTALAPEWQWGWRRAAGSLAGLLLAIGGAGFFGAALSGCGGLNWLGNSFEWPAGWVGGVVNAPDGRQFVPHVPSGRIQVYGPQWRFLTGWHVDAGGGIFKLLPPAGDRIEVITVRGQQRYAFDLKGQLLAQASYAPQSYNDFPDAGISCVVPTAPWLWTFTHPFFSWATALVGGLLLGWLRWSTPSHEATDPPNAAAAEAA